MTKLILELLMACVRFAVDAMWFVFLVWLIWQLLTHHAVLTLQFR